MKKLLLITALAILSLAAFAQGEGPLKFMGIPIDGSKASFETKLKSKGFRYNSVTEGYKGQFNGRTVDVFVHTNHDIVDRVYVAFPMTTEENIRNEYNRLLKQFNDTGKYIDLSFNEAIPDEEDISYEMMANNEHYQAEFTYFDNNRDPAPVVDSLVDLLADYYSEEDLVVLKAYMKNLIETRKEGDEAMQSQILDKIRQLGAKTGIDIEAEPEKALRFLYTFLDGMKSLADGRVWFTIDEYYGRYNIGLYYDNLHNQAHGEDL